MPHWCRFCQMEHSSNSCYHPGNPANKQPSQFVSPIIPPICPCPALPEGCVVVDLSEFAYLKVRKAILPPKASLVIAYDDGTGLVKIDDELYSGLVVVQRDDLILLCEDGFDQEIRSVTVWDAYDRLKAAIEETP